MNDMRGVAGRDSAPASAFEFTGDWKEFLPIALTNLLLTIVTLGIYRFWAKARERRYLWSRTRFIDDALEWTGTGKEMFLGFLVVMLVLLPTFFAISLGFQALAMRGQVAAALLLVVCLYLGLFYLIGVAQFRALRYRLSRTWWHGIRGGSDDGGWSFGWQFMGKTVLGFIAFGLLVPWAMVSLWNDRWSKMSFGQYPFTAKAESAGLFPRWLLVYAVPIVGTVVILQVAPSLFMAAATGSQPSDSLIGTLFAVVAGLYLALLLATLSFYAAFYRAVASGTSVGGVDFAFTARTKDWLKLILGTIALVIVTIGFGMMFVGYRNWSFAIRHMEATGEVNLDAMKQSQTRAPTDAEGLADAFDIGAI